MANITIKTVKLSAIKLNPDNPRRISEKDMDRLVKSLQDFPEMMQLREIVVDENMTVLGGNMRTLALRKIGAKECVAKIVTGLTHDQKREFIVKDNGTTWGEWDFDALANVWSDLPLADWGIDLPEDWLTGDKPEPKEDDFDAEGAADAIKCPVTQPRQIWTLGRHRVMCGDSTKVEDVKRLMGGGRADMVFADPPYGIDIVQGKNTGKVGGAAPTKFKTGTVGAGKIVKAKEYRVIEGDETIETAKLFYLLCESLNLKNIVLWGGNYFTGFLPPSRCWFVWDKEMTGNFSEAEMAWTSFDKGGIRVFKYLWNGLSREGERRLELNARVHPTQKPVGLFVMMLNRFDFLKTIFDGFLGSGSTLVACEETDRTCYGMEIDPVYCDVIVQRWETLTGQKATLEAK